MVLPRSFRLRAAALVCAAALAACGGSQSHETDGDAGDAGGDSARLPDDGAAPDSDSSDAATAALRPDHFFDGPVDAILHANGAWYVGGEFTVAGAFPAYHVAALGLGGAPASHCINEGGFDDVVGVSAVVPSGGSIFVGGIFSGFRGHPSPNLVKIDATSCAIDPTFSTGTGFNAGVLAIAVSGSSVYVGGAFTQYGTYTANSANAIAKLDATTGALDKTFSPPGASSNGVVTGNVSSLAVSGNALYVAGNFSGYRGVANAAHGIAKLDATTGVLDTTFSPSSATTSRRARVRLLLR